MSDDDAPPPPPPQPLRAPAPPPLASNPLQSLDDLRRALGDAAALGFIDNNKTAKGGRPRRTGYWIAERLCVPGVWTKRHQRSFKIAYLTGYDHAVTLGRGTSRTPRSRR